MTKSTLKTYTDTFSKSIPKEFNIGHACTQPTLEGFTDERIAILVDHLGEVDELSYRKLNELSNQFGHLLNARGFSKGDRVMLWLPNCSEFPIAFFGTLKIGAIAVPCSMMLTGEEMQYLAEDSGAGVLITTTALWKKFEAHAPSIDVILIDDERGLMGRITDHDVTNHPITTEANDPAYLVYTSGTTGYPKGVLHAHRALIGRTPSAHYWFDYSDSSDDRILHSGKFNWTYVLGTALMDPLFLGKTVVVYEGENQADTWPKLIAKHQCTIFIGVPTIYRQIIQKTTFSAEDVPTLRHCMSAGEHLSDEMLSAWNERFEQNIYEAIGMSECSYYLSQHPSKPIVPGSAGFPQPGHQIHLLDESLNPVEDEQEGMLCVHLNDPGLFLNYWNLPDVTAASRKGHFFLTGDYARRDKDGYIWFLGRKDDIINSFGFRISPHEIERVLKTHPNVADCVAVEEEIEKDKSLVVVHLIRKEPSLTTESELIHYAQDHLAKYKVPKKIYFTDAFPRTANGKIIRSQLRK